jgi:hypothetical protein
VIPFILEELQEGGISDFRRAVSPKKTSFSSWASDVTEA